MVESACIDASMKRTEVGDVRVVAAARDGWYYDIFGLFGAQARIVLTNGMYVDDAW